MKAVLASGAVFISYRSTDGKAIARATARTLRASGVPVWLDETDLPPGDITSRLIEALEGGLSGGVLVVTPGVRDSPTIRELEAPRLLELASDASFAFGIVSTEDHRASAQLLGIDAQRIGGFKHYAVDEASVRTVGLWMARNRLARTRAGRESEPLVISIQSRTAHSAGSGHGDLIFRTIPPSDGRVPSREVWEDLRGFLAGLPLILNDVGATRVSLTGGSHLAMGFALGAALPRTTPYKITVNGTDGSEWAPPATIGQGLKERLMYLGADWVGRLSRGRPLAVLVDVNPSPADDSFDRFVSRMGKQHRKHKIEVRATVSSAQGSDLVGSAATAIRRLAARQSTSTVDLFLRTPWPLAVLLGRELNTLQINLYEWENRDSVGTYVPVIAVASGSGSGPIIGIS